MTTTTYTASTAVLANPRRGFFQYTETHQRTDGSGFTPLVSADLLAARTGSTVIGENGTNITFSGRTIVFRYFYMEAYKVNGSTIPQAYLDKVTADLAAIKAAGCVARLRFAYDDTYNGAGPWASDVNLATMLAHQNQLAAVINPYADVVDSVDAGLIGTYGEWFYTSNFTTSGDLNAPNATDVSNRNAVIANWLSKLDARIFVNLRYVGSRMAFLASTSPNPGGDAVRLGHHNDALFADDGNYGTYQSQMTFAARTIAQARAYVDGMANVPISGESANYAPPGSDWAPTTSTWGGAAAELAQHHYVSINPMYHPDTLKAWGQTNIDTAQRSLGYRLRLVDATLAASVGANGTTPLVLRLVNDGYAAPVRNRPVQIILSNGTVTTTTLANLDVRTLAPGVLTTVSVDVAVPGTAGTYQAYLALPDPSTSLQALPAYNVQTANTGLYDSATGRHNLALPLTVTASGGSVSTIYQELYNGTDGSAIPTSSAYSLSGTGTLTYSAAAAVEGGTGLRAAAPGGSGGFANIDHSLPAATTHVWHSWVTTLPATPYGENIVVEAIGTGATKVVDVRVMADNSVTVRTVAPAPAVGVVIGTLPPQPAGSQVRIDVEANLTNPGSQAAVQANMYAGDIGKTTPDLATGVKTTATALTELRSVRLGITAAPTNPQVAYFDREIVDGSVEPAGPSSPPGQPVATAGAAGDTTAALSWTVPSTGSSALVSQEVQYASDPAGPWTTASAAVGAAARSYTVTGLVNGRSYYLRVRAVNGTSSSAWSNVVGPVTPAAAGSVVSLPTGDVYTVGCTGVGSSTAGLWTALADTDPSTYVLVPAGSYLQEAMADVVVPLPAGRQLTVEVGLRAGTDGTVQPALYDGDTFVVAGPPIEGPLTADGTYSFTLGASDLAKISSGGADLSVRLSNT